MEYRISKLIYKSLSGELTSNEQSEFDAWLSEEGNEDFYRSVLRSKSINAKFEQYDSFDSDAAFRKLSTRIPAKTGKVVEMKIRTFVKYAAVLLVAIGLGWTVLNQIKQTDEQVVSMAAMEKSNPNGRKSTFDLPDGTIVNLNSASKVRYFEDATTGRRIVELEGEAFFNVAKDENRPFTVIAGDISTTALGTSFNVKFYPKEKEFKVVLLTGKVEVRKNNQGPKNKIFLTPGFGVTYSEENPDLVKYNFDSDFELGWKNNILHFDEANIDDVVQELERWYGVTINIVNKDKVKLWKYSSKFKNESLENVLKGIGYIQEFDYKIENRNVTLIF
ncbi:MAG: FecR domain-containing protein [Cyclobacteriaceae bacterium]